ncbi:MULTISPECIES: hypothetical protein [unclassified Microcoleus]|uniref:hypothetical protein n=1 Tax=unclassified Microcoleus TaxID=2642155 RepID=UPI001DFAA267|nr:MULTISPECIES: hypothetical protein [unclassified Microcoleus]MCC3441278.1 hypothetical protein [Microcoleus sp. PH2017_03_ELD_O_A]MCC3502581.1 hypothetical protein [Microcoleus sp. PH2017_19_SFW_U_A]TAE12484.1 MAG: hypothetical protein EAZ94_12925 [Oscillatoriales cyanobacterium]MCC3415201.1 hypothetical protein [Microcoleus sp. PH2017_02_FOX_O_A]MCC3448467.1 hypothetical protein [Microcoleus sp. PH2017_09_SFU_O_A]
MSVIKRFVILEDRQKSLETTIDFLLNCQEYSWDKIYLFSAFVTNHGVEQVKKILLHPYLNENTEVVIAIGKKDNFNDPSDIQNLLKFIDKESTKIKTKSVRFICPTNNFHIKAYCFLGRRVRDNEEIVIDHEKIGFSIIGSSNLTRLGLECEGELCISIHNLNLTNQLINFKKNKYDESPEWEQEIIEYEIKYNEKHFRKDQALITSTPQNGGKFLKLGVTDDIAIIDQGTNLVNGRENTGWFRSIQTIDEEKNDVPKNSLCLLFSTENKIFQIGEIMSHSSDQTEGCFVTYTVNVTYKLSDDIRDILANEKYKIISNPEDMEKLPYDALKDFENEVKEYQEYQKMLDDPKYQKWIKKGKNKMQSEIERISKIDDISLIKKELELLRQFI